MPLTRGAHDVSPASIRNAPQPLFGESCPILLCKNLCQLPLSNLHISDLRAVHRAQSTPSIPSALAEMLRRLQPLGLGIDKPNTPLSAGTKPGTMERGAQECSVAHPVNKHKYLAAGQGTTRSS